MEGTFTWSLHVHGSDGWTKDKASVLARAIDLSCGTPGKPTTDHDPWYTEEGKWTESDVSVDIPGGYDDPVRCQMCIRQAFDCLKGQNGFLPAEIQFPECPDLGGSR